VERLRALASAAERVVEAATTDEIAAVLSREAASLAGVSEATVTFESADGHPSTAARRGDRVDGGRVAVSLPVGPPDCPHGVIALVAGPREADPGEDAVALVRVLAAAADGRLQALADRCGAGSPAEVRSAGGSDAERGVLERDASAERRRIARDLHDGLIQSLYGLGLVIRAQAERIDIPERGRTTMLAWVERIDRLVGEARTYVGDLEAGGDAVAELGAGLDAIAESAAAAGLDVSTEVRATEQVRPDDEVRRTILQVAREAVSNAVRHARASQVLMRVEVDPGTDTVVLTVEDDGVGFEPAAQCLGGYGLRNMAARAAALGGSLDVVSRPHAGARIRLRVGLHAHLDAQRGDD
jgi:two-component system NarL family sensor kinase